MQHDNDNAPAIVANSGAASDNNPLTFISMFSGIEAASQAFPQWKALRFAEIEKFPSAVLAFHYPDVPNVGDMTAHDWSQYAEERTGRQVDIVCGGPPCQAFSVAGLRNSMADARGNLSLAYMRALHAIKPRNAIVENVPGRLNTPDNAFGCFLAGLVGADDPLHTPDGKSWPNFGMVAGPLGRAAWRVLDAQYFGLAQRRRRVIVVADFGNGADPAAVLFEPEGVCRHSPPSRETGEGVAGAAKGGAGGCGESVAWSIMPQNSGKDYKARRVDVAQPIMAGGPVGGNQGGDYIQQYAPEIARCVATREGSSQDYESTTMVAVGVHGQVAHTLKAEGADASEDGTGRGTPVIAFNAEAQAGQLPHAGRDTSVNDGLTVSQRAAVAKQSAVRRLTPRECERLQGFPDDYTLIPVGKKLKDEAKEELAAYFERTGQYMKEVAPGEWVFDRESFEAAWPATSADGPRYKALGNSWAVPLFAWLGKRIDAHMPPVATTTEDNRLAA